MDITLYFIIAIIILMAAMLQGVTGFGFSLLAVPLLSFVLPLKIIVPLLVLYSLILNILVFSKVKGKINKVQIIVLVLFGLAFIPVGIKLLNSVDENLIKLIVGIIIIISAISMNFGYKIKFKNQNIAFAVTGMLSGILNGASALSGPPVILMLSNEKVKKENFRKTLAIYFLVLNLFTIPIFIYEKMMTSEIISYSIKLFPALVIGALVGIKFGNKLPEKIFRKVTLILIFVMGVLTVMSTLG